MFRSSMEEEIRGFRELFDKFISEPGPSVEWENIQVSFNHHHGVDYCHFRSFLSSSWSLSFCIIVIIFRSCPPIPSSPTQAWLKPVQQQRRRQARQRWYMIINHTWYTNDWKSPLKAMLDQLVVVKLNGALATALGCRWLPILIIMIMIWFEFCQW